MCAINGKLFSHSKLEFMVCNSITKHIDLYFTFYDYEQVLKKLIKNAGLGASCSKKFQSTHCGHQDCRQIILKIFSFFGCVQLVLCAFESFFQRVFKLACYLGKAKSKKRLRVCIADGYWIIYSLAIQDHCFTILSMCACILVVNGFKYYNGDSVRASNVLPATKVRLLCLYS